MQDTSNNPETEFEIALRANIIPVNTWFHKEQKEKLLLKIDTIKSVYADNVSEKVFWLVWVVFEAYQNSSRGTLSDAINTCLASYFPGILNKNVEYARGIKDCFQCYVENRMAQKTRILKGITGNTHAWIKYSNKTKVPNGVIEIQKILQDENTTDFQKWFLIKTHIKKIIHKGHHRHPYTIMLYNMIFNDAFLEEGGYLFFQDEFWWDPESTQSPKRNTAYQNIHRPILRLKAIEDFEHIPRELRKNILGKMGMNENDWDRENFTIQIIANDENFSLHYSDRVDSIHAGVCLLLKVLPEDNPYKPHTSKLESYLHIIVEKCKAYFKILEESDGPLEYYQASIVNYLKFIVETLSSAIGMNKKKVESYLGLAENFALMQRPRPFLCTIIQISKPKHSNLEYIILVDQPINPFSTKILEEFSYIQNDVEKEFPLWFKKGFDPYEKALLVYTLREINFKTLDNKSVYAVSSKLRLVPVPSNFGRHTLVTYNKRDKTDEYGEGEVVEYPPEYRSSHIGSRDVLSSNNSEKMRIIHAENNLKYEVECIIQDEVQYLQQLIESKFKDNENALEEISDVTEITIPILFQTLVSPIGGKQPDSSLNEDKVEAIKRVQDYLDNFCHTLKLGKIKIAVKFNIISTNHPLNIAKYADYTTKNSDNGKAMLCLIHAAWSKSGIFIQNIINFIDNSEEHFKNIINRLRLLKNATTELEKCLDAKAFENFNEERELYLASLSQMVASFFHFPTVGSCVSGKDRKAVEIMYTDAMQKYTAKYGRILKLEDTAENKENFAEIFVEIYCSKHFQTNSAQNAPGCNGIKTPDGLLMGYLPQYLQKAIERWYNEKSTQDARYKNMDGSTAFCANECLASNNELEEMLAVTPDNQNGNTPHWKPPLETCHKVFSHKTEEEWEVSVNLGRTEIIKQRNSLSLFYAEFLTSSVLNVKQKLLVLYALFTDKRSGEEFNQLQLSVCHAMGFVVPADAQKFILKYLRQGDVFKNNAIIQAIQIKCIRNKIADVEKIKLELVAVFSEESKIINPQMSLLKKSYIGICQYNKSNKGSGKGIPRGYAYANLLDSLSDEKQKMVVLYALLICNENKDKNTKLQKMVLSSIKMTLEEAQKFVYKEINDNQVDYAMIAKGIMQDLNNSPPLEQIQNIKKELNKKIPTSVTRIDLSKCPLKLSRDEYDNFSQYFNSAALETNQYNLAVCVKLFFSRGNSAESKKIFFDLLKNILTDLAENPSGNDNVQQKAAQLVLMAADLWEEVAKKEIVKKEINGRKNNKMVQFKERIIFYKDLDLKRFSAFYQFLTDPTQCLEKIIRQPWFKDFLPAKFEGFFAELEEKMDAGMLNEFNENMFINVYSKDAIGLTDQTDPHYPLDPIEHENSTDTKYLIKPKYMIIKFKKNYFALGSTFIGKGGQGTVVKAYVLGSMGNLITAQPFAAKIIPKDPMETEEVFEKKLQEEAKLNRNNGLYHTIGPIKLHSGEYILLIPYVTGQNLSFEAIGKFQKTATLYECAEFGRGLTLAVANIHKNGVLHRDIKEDNFRFNKQRDKNGNIFYHFTPIDFGLSIRIEITDEIEENYIPSNCGTPAFSAPEVLTQKKACLRSDIYSCAPFDKAAFGAADPLGQRQYIPASQLEKIAKLKCENHGMQENILNKMGMFEGYNELDYIVTCIINFTDLCESQVPEDRPTDDQKVIFYNNLCQFTKIAEMKKDVLVDYIEKSGIVKDVLFASHAAQCILISQGLWKQEYTAISVDMCIAIVETYKQYEETGQQLKEKLLQIMSEDFSIKTESAPILMATTVVSKNCNQNQISCFNEVSFFKRDDESKGKASKKIKEKEKEKEKEFRVVDKMSKLLEWDEKCDEMNMQLDLNCFIHYTGQNEEMAIIFNSTMNATLIEAEIKKVENIPFVKENNKLTLHGQDNIKNFLVCFQKRNNSEVLNCLKNVLFNEAISAQHAPSAGKSANA